MKLNTVICGDIFNVMPEIADKSVDMILTDMPYNTTACDWDKEVIPLGKLWEGFKRIIKDNGAVVMTASQPFTSKLVMSNIKDYKYDWIWIKSHPSNSLLAKKQPLKYHENICVFYHNQPIYNPQMTIGKINHKRNKIGKMPSEIIGQDIKIVDLKYDGKKYPKSYYIDNTYLRGKMVHPTQKPVALFEYLIKTYTNKGDTVFDGFAGSGTTGVACQNLNRKFILIEKEQKYVDIIKKRLAQGVLNI